MKVAIVTIIASLVILISYLLGLSMINNKLHKRYYIQDCVLCIVTGLLILVFCFLFLRREKYIESELAVWSIFYILWFIFYETVHYILQRKRKNRKREPIKEPKVILNDDENTFEIEEDKFNKLEKLHELKTNGVITEEEYVIEKNKILH